MEPGLSPYRTSVSRTPRLRKADDVGSSCPETTSNRARERAKQHGGSAMRATRAPPHTFPAQGTTPTAGVEPRAAPPVVRTPNFETKSQYVLSTSNSAERSHRSASPGAPRNPMSSQRFSAVASAQGELASAITPPYRVHPAPSQRERVPVREQRRRRQRLRELGQRRGRELAATGIASIAFDRVVLTGSGMPNSCCLYFQGTAGGGVACHLDIAHGVSCTNPDDRGPTARRGSRAGRRASC